METTSKGVDVNVLLRRLNEHVLAPFGSILRPQGICSTEERIEALYDPTKEIFLTGSFALH
jgi:hypothetical protein